MKPTENKNKNKDENKNIKLAEAYYNAIIEKNLAQIAQYLDPNVSFLSPLFEFSGKDAFLKAAEGFMHAFKTLKIRAKFASEDQAVLIYDLDCPPPISHVRAAALFNFKNGLITRLELFFDASVFKTQV